MNANELYAPLVAVRNIELQMLWQRFNINLVVNGGLLLAYLSARENAVLRQLGVMIPIFGIALALAWLLSENFGRRNLAYFDAKLQALEDAHWSEGNLGQLRVFLGIPEYFRRQAVVSQLLICIFLVAWIILICRIACLR